MRRSTLSTLLFAAGSVLVLAGIALQALVTPGIVLAGPNLQTEPFDDFACLDCHTDKSRLNELAPLQAQEEAEESLSSGPG